MFSNQQLATIISLISLLVLTSTAEDGNNEKFKRESNILSRYFAMEGFDINVKDLELVGRYDSEVITEMEKAVENYQDTLKVFHLNSMINTLIYKLKKVNVLPPESCKPFEPMDEALLQTIDLMLPNSKTEPLYRLAKDDLRKFYIEQPELGKELLARIRNGLETMELHTDEVAKYMRNFYYRWIPLGRLAEFIKTNAKNT